MREYFLERVEQIRRELSNNNHSDVLVKIDYRYELVYFKICKKYLFIYTFKQIYEDVTEKWQ